MSKNRPLSPHLSIHKRILTALFSIFHRITGIGLSLGSIILTSCIFIISLGPNYFFIYELITHNLIFKLVLLIWTLGFFYHLYNGIRYLYWSYGLGMSLKTVYTSSYIVLFITLLSTILVWYL